MANSLNHLFDPSSTDVDSYNLWICTQIAQRLTDNKQTIPHDECGRAFG